MKSHKTIKLMKLFSQICTEYSYKNIFVDSMRMLKNPDNSGFQQDVITLQNQFDLSMSCICGKDKFLVFSFQFHF